MAKHSNVGASSCERWWNCPGSVALIATLGPMPTSEYAEEGTAAHEFAEKCLREGKDAVLFLGETSSNGFVMDEEMRESVQLYLDVIRADQKEFEKAGVELEIERKFHLVHIDEGAFGTSDAVLRVFLKKVIVYDFKYGQGLAVRVEDNKQGKYYALGALVDGDYDEVEIVIVQPRAPIAGDSVRRWTTSREELERFGEEMKTRIAATREAKAPLVCGEHCKKTFCPAMPVCPEIRKKAELLAPRVFESVEPIVLPDPVGLTPLQLRRALDLADLLQDWLKAVKSYALDIAMKGEKVLDHKLVRGRAGNRQWSSEAEVVKTLELEYGEDIYEKKLKSPAQMEKVIGKKNVDVFCVRPEGKLILVPESDKREAIAVDPNKVFAGVEQQTEQIE